MIMIQKHITSPHLKILSWHPFAVRAEICGLYVLSRSYRFHVFQLVEMVFYK